MQRRFLACIFTGHKTRFFRAERPFVKNVVHEAVDDLVVTVMTEVGYHM